MRQVSVMGERGGREICWWNATLCVLQQAPPTPDLTREGKLAGSEMVKSYWSHWWVLMAWESFNRCVACGRCRDRGLLCEFSEVCFELPARHSFGVGWHRTGQACFEKRKDAHLPENQKSGLWAEVRKRTRTKQPASLSLSSPAFSLALPLHTRTHTRTQPRTSQGYCTALQRMRVQVWTKQLAAFRKLSLRALWTDAFCWKAAESQELLHRRGNALLGP